MTSKSRSRLAIVASHPIQYYSPLFRELEQRIDLQVLYAHLPTGKDQAAVGFGVDFEWDVDLMSGYQSEFLKNAAREVSLERFGGLDTPNVYERLKRMKPDALLVLGWHFKSYIQAIVAAKRLRTPVLVRGDSQLETPRSWSRRAVKAVAYPVALRAFDAALYVGERSRRYWEHYHYPDSRLFFSPHCIDNAWFRELATAESAARFRAEQGLTEASRIVLFVGKLTANKRPLDLIEAVALVRHRNPDLVTCFAGAGVLSEEIAARATALDVPTRMLGFCNQTELPAIYKASAILALTSESETWGLVANEALACGTPVLLSSACGSAPDLVADARAGRQYPVGDVQALADQIDEIVSCPPRSEEIHRKADSYSLAAAADGIVEAMDSVVGRA